MLDNEQLARSAQLVYWVIGLGFRYCPHGQGTKVALLGNKFAKAVEMPCSAKLP